MSTITSLQLYGQSFDFPTGSSAHVNDDTLYISNNDADSNNINVSNFEYSEEERVVGCWINGKPIYEKTINAGHIGLTHGQLIEHNIDNIHTVVHGNVILKDDSDEIMPWTAISELNSFLTNSQSNHASLGFRVNTKYVMVMGGNTWNQSDGRTIYIILQYTKTTDLPNSFKPSMLNIKSIVPQHNYSTEEKVVGTWIDGKSIYEKTVVITDGIKSGEQAYNLGITNIKNITNYTIYAIRGINNNIIVPIPNSVSGNWATLIDYITPAKVDITIGSAYTSGDAKINKIIIILQYTKTTD